MASFIYSSILLFAYILLFARTVVPRRSARVGVCALPAREAFALRGREREPSLSGRELAVLAPHPTRCDTPERRLQLRSAAASLAPLARRAAAAGGGASRASGGASATAQPPSTDGGQVELAAMSRRGDSRRAASM